MCEYIIYSVEHEYVSLETFTGICSIFVNFAFPLNQFGKSLNIEMKISIQNVI